MELIKVKVDELELDDRNSRKHGDADIEATKLSLLKFGQQTAIVLSPESNHIVKGNGTVMATRRILAEQDRAEARIQAGEPEEGDEELVAQDWSELWAVRTNLEGAEQRAYSIADNKTGVLAPWDMGNIGDAFKDFDSDGMLESLAIGWSPGELTRLTDPGGSPGDDEEMKGLGEDFDPQRGDIFLVKGHKQTHRLMVGDCRDFDDVARLAGDQKWNVAVTSPPYAEQREYDEDSGFRPIPPSEYVDWFEEVQAGVSQHLTEDGSWFVNIKPAAVGLDRLLYVLDLVLAHVRRWEWHFADEFCWERIGPPQAIKRRFKNNFEPVYQFAKNEWKMRPEAVQHESKNVPVKQSGKPGPTEFAGKQGTGDCAVEGNDMAEGLANASNRLPPFQSEALGHPAAFPVGLPEFFIKAYSDIGDVIYDPFTGSGSTAVAAERQNRQFLGMELSGKYMNIALNRMVRIGCEVEKQ